MAYVGPYRRRNGKRVKGHYRRRPVSAGAVLFWAIVIMLLVQLAQQQS